MGSIQPLEFEVASARMTAARPARASINVAYMIMTVTIF